MPLFPIGQTINYNYINNVSENYFCCQVTITITRIIPLRLIYVIISWAMVLRNQFWIAVTERPAEELILDCSYSSKSLGKRIAKDTVADRNSLVNHFKTRSDNDSYRQIFGSTQRAPVKRAPEEV